MAKGAGMINPNMATMLCVVTTDAKISKGTLQNALHHAAERTFNRITVDGDMSTNDTMLALANGAAGGASIKTGTSDYALFLEALNEVCLKLAHMIVRDGEGVSKFVTVQVRGASSLQAARKVAEAVNRKFGAGSAQALDGRTVQVRAPVNPNDRVSFIAEMEELPVESSVAAAKVIINSRTGSIVLNQAVTLGACAIAHGNLSITISSTPVISQPNALSGGQTVVTEKANIDINQAPGKLIQIPAATQLSDVVRALNSLGATPQDLLAILQAIKSAGALNAELEVI
jgi:peptidyl-tRNA hydrolase